MVNDSTITQTRVILVENDIITNLSIVDSDNIPENYIQSDIGDPGDGYRNGIVIPQTTKHDYMEIAKYFLNNYAKERKYDDIISMCSYINDPDPIFNNESKQAVEIRSMVYKYTITIMSRIEDNTITRPDFWEFYNDLKRITTDIVGIQQNIPTTTVI